jgi:hypothetical protein
MDHLFAKRRRAVYVGTVGPGEFPASRHDLFTGDFILFVGLRGSAWLDAADQARTATGARLSRLLRAA